jgi:hypothetical protein
MAHPAGEMSVVNWEEMDTTPRGRDYELAETANPITRLLREGKSIRNFSLSTGIVQQA